MAVLMMWGCGQVDPDITPVTHGAISVTSVPSGAAILLNDQTAGTVTPDTLTMLAPGRYTVAVWLEGYDPEPEFRQVDVAAGYVASAHFDLEPRVTRPVLLESFTNTGCIPCAEANPMMYELLRELGPQQVLMLEFHIYFPSPLDPFYLAQRNLMDSRASLYQVGQAPWLIVEGTQGLQPLTREAVATAIEAAELNEAVDLHLHASITGSALSCSLRAEAKFDFGEYALSVFITDELIVFETPPGSNGETEFQHVVRGVLPAPEGELVQLDSTDPLWRGWDTSLPWFAEGDTIMLVADARMSGELQPRGVTFLRLP